MTSSCQLDSNQSSYYGLQRMGSERVGWGIRGFHRPITFYLSLRCSRWPCCHSSMTTAAFIPLIFCALPLSTSATPHPALRYSFYLSGEAHLHRLRGVIRGHAHTYHLAQRWPAHCARLRLWCSNRDQRLHEFSADHQGDAKAQWKLHLHRQQHRCHRQLGKTADRHR